MEKEKEDKISNSEPEGDKDDGGDHEDDHEDEHEHDNGGDNDSCDVNQSNSDNSNLQSENSTDGQKTKKKISRAVKEILTNNDTKFISNFESELGNRERRKLTRKLHSEGKKNGSVIDESNTVNCEEKDVCDCLVEDCPGCHFPCPKCRSCKCGVECRVNRKWMCEAVENEADITVPKFIDDSAS